jgi:hypothetical protein
MSKIRFCKKLLKKKNEKMSLQHNGLISVLHIKKNDCIFFFYKKNNFKLFFCFQYIAQKNGNKKSSRDLFL